MLAGGLQKEGDSVGVVLAIGIHLQGVSKSQLVGLFKPAYHGRALATVLGAGHEHRIRHFTGHSLQDGMTLGSIAVIYQNYRKTLGRKAFRHLAGGRFVPIHGHDSAKF